MAKGNRAAAEAVILKRVEQMAPGGPTPQIYRDLFAKLDDDQFHTFMMQLKNKQFRLPIIAPNMSKHPLTAENALALAKEMGHEFRQHIWINPNDGVTPAYKTNKRYFVLDMPYRRQAQIQEKKVRIPRHNRSIDDLTGQPAGESKGSTLSSPELQVLAALDLPELITELIKYRGGDVKGFDAMTDMIAKTGQVSTQSIKHLAGGVESTKVLSTYLNCMHLSNTL